jgi:hypothetical protein
MIRQAALRRLGPLFVGLYFVAQICGVIPLESCYSAHAGIGPSVLFECKVGKVALHHSGDADDAAAHHALQDLIGVLALLPDRSEIAFVHAAIIVRHTQSLAEADPVLLERPPKRFLSI